MKEIISLRGIDIFQHNFQQVLIRSNGGENLSKMIKEETSLDVPNENLKISANKESLLAKNSFDQWSLIYLKEKSHKDLIKLFSSINLDQSMLASDYSYGQVYFNISGEKRNFYLNKLTHFDLRPKKFLVSTMAQTLIAGIDCSIYNFNDNYVITCNKSFEGYFKERLLDAINL